VQALEQLHHRRRDILPYGVNLFAARLSALLGSDVFGGLAGDRLVRARELLREANEVSNRIRQTDGMQDFDGHQSNIALLQLAMGDFDAALQTLAPLQHERSTDTVLAYCAIALDRTGRGQEAAATLKAAEESFGDTDVIRAAREQIAARKPFVSGPALVLDQDPLPRIKEAFHDFSQMDHERQSEIFRPRPQAFDRLTIDYVRDAAGSVVALVPMMRGVAIDASEDDLTAMIRELLAGRFHHLGWSVSDQSKGGFTAKGNPGERDLVVRKGSTTLAVLEAVVCDRPVTTKWTVGELTSHFQKLYAYSTCRLFFHLTYAYIANPASVLDLLRTIAKDKMPDGFTFDGCEDVPLTDSRPSGLIARYTGEFGEVKVVFLVVDLGQHHQKAAAKTAAASNPRKKAAKKRGSK
jgi:Tetratricopeptide repeat